MKSDFSLLIQATLKIYQESLLDAFRGVSRNWRMILVHLLYLVLIGLLIPLSMMFGSLAGSFILGLFFAVLLGHYLMTVSGAVEGDVLYFEEAKSRAFELFSPTLSALFALFIIQILSSSLFGTPEKYWLRTCVGLFVTVLFNPIPEVIYHRPSTMTEMFATSFEFIRENFVEWFFPVVVFLLPIFLFMPSDMAVSLMLGYFTSDPLHIISSVFLSFGGVLNVLLSLPLLLVMVTLLYFLMVFRGQLYTRLSGSTRRKRVYQQRHS